MKVSINGQREYRCHGDVGRFLWGRSIQYILEIESTNILNLHFSLFSLNPVSAFIDTERTQNYCYYIKKENGVLFNCSLANKTHKRQPFSSSSIHFNRILNKQLHQTVRGNELW